MSTELVCKGMNIVLKPFTEDLWLHQRLKAPVLSPRASACYTPLQDVESRTMLKNFLHSNDHKTEFERFAASITYTLIYGLRISTNKEWQIEASHVNLANLDEAGRIGAWVVDFFPILNHLPALLAPWKKTAEKWHEQCTSLSTRNLSDALLRPGWNWAKDFHNASEAREMSHTALAWDLDMLCEAGVGTTSDVLQIFLLACIAYPSFLPVAQKEIDAVVGRDRLPDFADLENLPYIAVIIEETFRWRHILPAGIPHATTQEDIYNGYVIPKGSTIVPLFAAMRNDSMLFDAPAEFRPERWLGNAKSQSGNFGYGRRVCPGRFIAKNSLGIAVARLLWGFEIKAKDGKKVQVDEDMFTTGFVSHPKEFEVVFEVREGRKEVIERECEGGDEDVGRLMDGIKERLVKVGLSPRA
jgi:cytochrome P450